MEEVMETNTVLFIKLDEKLKKDFQIECIKDGKPMSELISEMIENYLKTRK